MTTVWNIMTLKDKISVLAVLIMAAGCVEEKLEMPSGNPEDGRTCITLRTQAPDQILTKSSEGEDRIENAAIFVFDGNGECLARQWSYVGEDKKVYMYLPAGPAEIYAVCNMLDPEALMNSVETLDDLKSEAVTVTEWSGAYKGKYVMSGSTPLPASVPDVLTIPVTRVAAQFDIRLFFKPVNSDDQFMVSEVALHNVPKGTWILPHEAHRGSLSETSGVGASIDESGNFVLAETGSTDDWTYMPEDGDMNLRYFDRAVMSYEGSDISSDEGLSVSFSMFENRRGVLDTSISDPAVETDAFAVNWPELYRRSESQRSAYAQLWKYGLWENVCRKSHTENAGMKYAAFLTVSGVYSVSDTDKREVTYYIFLGEDNFSSYDVKRNYKYDMDVTIRTIDRVDTRVDDEQISEMKVYYNEESVLDAHCNSVRTLLFSPSGWEVWVKNPDETPWVELSTSAEYKPAFLGTVSGNGEAGFRIKDNASGMRYIYIHTDEYVPDLGSPEANNSAPVREATVCYRPGASGEITEFTVRQYPAQMVILYIEHDVNNLMQEVRDTFYIERTLEQKHMIWGFERDYWSLEMDKLISKGQWDGLTNTRTLYDCAMDFYGDPSAPEGENCIPNNVALRYVLDKNRDRNGNGYVDRDEIMWFMPAINEMEALYEAREKLLVEFEGDDDYFFSSTPSSSDPSGITYGYAYYIKMGSGKTGLAQRNMEYNFIACRRTNAWRGPETASGSGTVNKDETWNEEEVIMPKN